MSENKGTRLLRTKKFLASRLSETKRGRKWILQFLGPAGDGLLAVLESAATKHSGSEKTAQELKLHIFKIATKIGVLMQNGELAPEAWNAAQAPSGEFVVMLQEALEASNEAQRQVEPLAAALCRVHDAVLPVISGHMKQSNAARITHLRDFYADRAFVEKFLKHGSFADERQRMLDTLVTLSQGSSDTIMLNRSINKSRLLRRLNALTELLESDSYEVFISNPGGTQVFQKWYLAQGHSDASHKLLCMNALRDFRAVSSKSLLHTRATSIYDKFLVPTGSHRIASIPEELVTQTGNDILANDVSRRLFLPVEAAIASQLAEAFADHFVGSEAWAAMQEERDETLQQLDSITMSEQPITPYASPGVLTGEDDGDDEEGDNDDDASPGGADRKPSAAETGGGAGEHKGGAPAAGDVGDGEGDGEGESPGGAGESKGGPAPP